MAETTADAVTLPFEEAIAFLRQKVNVTTRGWTDVMDEAHARAFVVAGASTDALVEDFRKAVTAAIEDGETLAQFRARFDEIVETHGWSHFGAPGWRSEIIYSTNLSAAYAAGRYAQMTDPDVLDAFPYWEYLHGDSLRPRPMHLSWNGLVLRADDPWWQSHYPPNGWRCSCYVEPVMRDELHEGGRRGLGHAPDDGTVEWRDPKTGEARLYPKGIDPGFGGNPGAAWQRGQVATQSALRCEAIDAPASMWDRIARTVEGAA